MYSEEVQRFNLDLPKVGQHKNAVARSGLRGLRMCGYEGIFLLLKAMRESLLLVMEGVFTTEARESLLLNYVGTYLRDEV